MSRLTVKRLVNGNNCQKEAIEVKGVLDVLGLNGPESSPKGNWEMTAKHLRVCFCQPKQAAHFAACLTPHFSTYLSD